MKKSLRNYRLFFHRMGLLFLFIPLIVLILSIVLPDRGFSEKENRVLSSLPHLNGSQIASVGVNGGYVHLGDTMIYLAAAFLPLPYACAAGAIGGGLADLLTAPVWAPATIIIKMLICLPFSSKGTKLVTKRNVVALFLAFAISATGYYIAEGIMFGFTASFFTSVSGSIVQSGGSAIMFVIIGTALDKIGFKTNIAK